MAPFNNVLKHTIEDIIYSVRASIKYLTDLNSEIRLESIYRECEYDDTNVIHGKIKNFVGGHIECIYPGTFNKILSDNTIDYSDEILIEYTSLLFDYISNISKHQLFDFQQTDYKDAKDAQPLTYYIQFSVQIYNQGHVLKTNIIFGVDSMTDVYFGELSKRLK